MPHGWLPALIGSAQDSTPNEDHLSNMRMGLTLALLQDIAYAQLPPAEQLEPRAQLALFPLPRLLGLSAEPASASGMLLLFPAWPGQWDADIRLHASLNTTID